MGGGCTPCAVVCLTDGSRNGPGLCRLDAAMIVLGLRFGLDPNVRLPATIQRRGNSHLLRG
jgi:hypothetical protein